LVNPEVNDQRKELFDIFSSIFSKEKQEEQWQIENPF
jgi:hypothetical protein